MRLYTLCIRSAISIRIIVGISNPKAIINLVATLSLQLHNLKFATLLLPILIWELLLAGMALL